MSKPFFFPVKVSKYGAPKHQSKGDSQCWGFVSLPHLKFSKDHIWHRYLCLKYSRNESEQTYLIMQIRTMYIYFFLYISIYRNISILHIEIRQAGLAFCRFVCLCITILKFKSPYLVLLLFATASSALSPLTPRSETLSFYNTTSFFSCNRINIY